RAPGGVRHRLERADPDHRSIEPEGDPLARRHADPHAGEGARAHVAGERVELPLADPGGGERLLDDREQALGVGGATVVGHPGEDRAVARHRHRAPWGRRRDREEDHRRRPRPRNDGHLLVSDPRRAGSRPTSPSGSSGSTPATMPRTIAPPLAHRPAALQRTLGASAILHLLLVAILAWAGPAATARTTPPRPPPVPIELEALIADDEDERQDDLPSAPTVDEGREDLAQGNPAATTSLDVAEP